MVCVRFQISCVWCQSWWISKKCPRSCVFFCFCYAKNCAEIPVDRWWEKDRSMCWPSGGEKCFGSEVFRHRMLCSQLTYWGAHCLSESQGGKGRDCGSHFLRVWRKGTAPVQNFRDFGVIFAVWQVVFSTDSLRFSQLTIIWIMLEAMPRWWSRWGRDQPANPPTNGPNTVPRLVEVPSVKVYGGRIDKVAACTNPLEWGGVFDRNLQGDRLQIPSPNFQWKKQMDCCL